MDAAANDGTAFADGFKSLRHEVAYRRKDDSRIKFFRRQVVRAAGPNRTEVESEFFCFFVCGPGESIDFPLLIRRHLRDDVRGSAEALNAEPLAVPYFNQTSVSDQTRAQKRRGFRIAIEIWDRKTEALIVDSTFGIAAVERVPRELRLVAEIFLPAPTVGTLATCPTQPRHADAVADFKASHRVAQIGDGADDFVAGHKRQFRLCQFAIDDVKIRSAHRACVNLDQNLTGAGLGYWQFRQVQRLAGLFKDHGAHHLNVYRK